MPDLFESLQGRDLGFLRIVADLWDLEFNAPDARVGLQRLLPLLLDPDNFRIMVDSLPSQARQALDDLLQNEGRDTWATFTRKYGLVREMGPGKRDRERPYAISPSPTEILWYRALIHRGFFDLPTGPAEFAFIPDDFVPMLPENDLEGEVLFGRPASASEKAFEIPATDRILDHACTLLAALRTGIPQEKLAGLWEGVPDVDTLRLLLRTAGLVDAAGMPQLEPVRQFLEGERLVGLAGLVQAWLESRDFDELRLLPGLQAEGEWQNDPVQARRAVLSFLPGLGNKTLSSLKLIDREKTFWSLAALVADVRKAEPDFQRLAGDYDSWYLRDKASGDYVKGFESWERVDGALIHYIISGPMHWLGILDLAAPAQDQSPTAFRFTTNAENLLAGRVTDLGLVSEAEQLLVRSDARIWCPRRVPRSARYQLARFCHWEEEKEDGYFYRVTPESLGRARQNGLRTSQLVGLLRKYAEAIPPNLLKALERWEERGTEARFQKEIILKLGSPEVMQALRNSRAARYLGDPLGPTTIVVHANAWSKVFAVLAELGYLSEVDLEEPG